MFTVLKELKDKLKIFSKDPKAVKSGKADFKKHQGEFLGMINEILKAKNEGLWGMTVVFLFLCLTCSLFSCHFKNTFHMQNFLLPPPPKKIPLLNNWKDMQKEIISLLST